MGRPEDDLDGHSTTLRQRARQMNGKRLRWGEKYASRSRQNPKQSNLLDQEVDPKQLYVVGKTIIQGDKFAGGILPANARPATPKDLSKQ